MPLRQQSPWSPFVSDFLSTLSSRHSSVKLWGTTAHECASLSANSFLGRMRTYVYDAWRDTKSALALFHNPQPQPQQRPGPPTPPPHISHINLESEKSLSRNRDSSGPCFCTLIGGPRATSAVIRLHRLGGLCQGAGVKWFAFKDQSLRLTLCQLHKRIYQKWLACGVLTLGGALKTAAGIFNSLFIYN